MEVPVGAGRSVSVVMAGGGTGGHLVPGIALADEIRGRLTEAQIVFLGTGRPVEKHLLSRTDYASQTVDAVRMPRSVTAVPLFPWRLWKSLRNARSVLRKLQPAIVIGLGGYGSFPVVWAARQLNIPSVLLEQNSVPGVANRWLSRWACEVYVQFEASREHFRRPERVFVLGNPLRGELSETGREVAARTFGLEPARKTLLVTGGSQGARRINQAVCDALRNLAAAGFQLIHQTGSADLSWVAERHEAVGITSHVAAFIDEMPDALSTADLVVARAGATTLAEIAALGRASILVPYPLAAHSHQHRNAECFEEAGASAILEDAKLNGTTLIRIVSGLMEDDARREAMALAARRLARPHAAADIAERILAILEGRQ